MYVLLKKKFKGRYMSMKLFTDILENLLLNFLSTTYKKTTVQLS